MLVRTCLRALAALLVSTVVLVPGPPATAHPVPAAAAPPAATSTSTTATTTAPSTAPVGLPAAPPSGAAPYVVRSGDTLTGIARATGTPGGWPELFAANRDVLGPSPDLLRVGTVLVLPGTSPAGAPAAQPSAQPAAVTTYEVAPGDSLRSVASRLGVDGGWPALYAANRSAVGPDPDRLAVGARLVVPAAVASAPAGPAPGTSAAPGAGAGTRLGAAPETPRSAPGAAPPASSGAGADGAVSSAVPAWVTWPMGLVAALAALVLVGDPLLALVRRRTAARSARTAAAAPAGATAAASAVQRPGLSLLQRVDDVGRPEEGEATGPCVHVERHPTLLVSYSPADDLVLLLLPEEHRVDDVLQVARVALPERAYRAVERRLPTPLRRPAPGPVSARWAG
ncbi:LysM peptidoglycan-binding domain-containing protein [Streptomyces sp. NP160]|uniref:LysM peptidoglycan-binding domain-containing protein n=1 Tax=Streptomyces sp. NP160 TaxID=2586637 RepID=UPI001118B254|nr:LysM domain-containing protein [Streptomyces sp. NP160]TNM67449.1 LysM peptidoglycan-binding domain-containing protein [Streptomyces sp. NP160]